MNTLAFLLKIGESGLQDSQLLDAGSRNLLLVRQSFLDLTDVPGNCGSPLVMNVHYRRTMDHWDPTITDGLAQQREVILFDNAGIGAS